MTQYIDKSALIAEIEKRRSEYINSLMTEQVHTLSDILDFIDTLEVKEVWKPNAEQMKVLWYLDNGISLNDFDKRVLHVLIDQLKKLREE